ncbi:hypothetical protein EDC01DRAFT_664454 [Geopyxis carbonaria]|nr:hypothetical protein EDC01DRAFT_664454 [Geopyxis carbonaria]
MLHIICRGLVVCLVTSEHPFLRMVHTAHVFRAFTPCGLRLLKIRRTYRSRLCFASLAVNQKKVTIFLLCSNQKH